MNNRREVIRDRPPRMDGGLPHSPPGAPPLPVTAPHERGSASHRPTWMGTRFGRPAWTGVRRCAAPISWPESRRPRRGGGLPTVSLDGSCRAPETPHTRVEGELESSSFHLPGSAQRKNNGSKTAGPRKNAPKTRKNQKAGTSGSPKPESRVHQPNGNNTSHKTPSTKANGTRQDHREYEQARNKTPERMEYNRRLAQEQRQQAKELGKCRDCPGPAITGQTRCPVCAEAHRQSRRRSDARRTAVDREERAVEE